jgi:DNA end-binding protein Ku
VNDFEPEQYVDEYQQELRTLIAAKLEQGDAIDTAATFGEQPEEDKGGEVIDLMEALRQSIASKRDGGGKESASGSRSGSASGSGSRSGSSKATGTAKKGAAGGEKKPAAKKTSAKSTSTKKKAAS